jgi:hypothetical protein
VTTFATAVDRLVNQVAHWEQPRWWTHPGGGRQTRADVVHALVQRLADLGAHTERRERRPVPRVGDMSLPDQLRVMADDLVRAQAPDEVLDRAAEDVRSVHQSL